MIDLLCLGFSDRTSMTMSWPRSRSLAGAEGTVTAVKRLRQTYPRLGLTDAVQIVDGDTRR